jgi:hypothetical protein
VAPRRRLSSGIAILAVAAAVVVGTAGPTLAAEVAAPTMYQTPTAVTTSTISVRFLRSPEPDRVCKPDIGYEVQGGTFTEWRDVGGFPNAPCDDPDPGYKFSRLAPGTTYTFSIRAYRLTDGVKDYSSVSSMTATTAGESPPPPTEPPPTPPPRQWDGRTP